MEALLNRYRNLSVLVVVVVAQLLLLAWQVKTSQDVRLIRVWAISTVTPVAGIVEAVRRNTIGFLEDYFILLDVREQNRKLRDENSKLKMENTFYRTELATADRARALTAFQSRTPSRTVAARVTGNSTVSTARCVFIDRGSASGIEKGMAVVTPDGIVGKVIAVYPLASQVLLVTDATFSVGVESQRGHLRGTLNCRSGSDCTVDYVQNEEHVDKGEVFYTSGEDRVFPKGFPVGVVSSAKPGNLMKEIHLTLSGAPAGAEEVLVVLEGTHQKIPDAPVQSTGPTRLLPPPPADVTNAPPDVRLQTEADKIKQRYVDIGKQQNHEFGGVGSNLPNFNPGTAKLPAGTAATTLPTTPAQASPSGQAAPAVGITRSTGPSVNGQNAAGQAPPNQSGTAPKPDALGARPPQKQPASNPVGQTAGSSAAGNPSAGTSPAGNPTATKPPVVKPKTPPPGPPLPLGAPKPKPKTTTTQPAAPRQPQNGPPPNE